MDTVTETFYISLQKGIEGGFAPPTPSARYLITRATRSNIFIVAFHERKPGTPLLALAVDRQLKVADYVKSINRFQEILSQIPVQYIGAEDVYGRNTSIVQITDPLKSVELHLSGSAAGKGIPHPTEEQKVLFDEAVQIVEKWGAPAGPSE